MEPNATPNRWYGLSTRQTTRSHNVDDQNIFQFETRPCVLGFQLVGRESAARGRLGFLQRLQLEHSRVLTCIPETNGSSLFFVPLN